MIQLQVTHKIAKNMKYTNNNTELFCSHILSRITQLTQRRLLTAV